MIKKSPASPLLPTLRPSPVRTWPGTGRRAVSGLSPAVGACAGTTTPAGFRIWTICSPCTVAAIYCPASGNILVLHLGDRFLSLVPGGRLDRGDQRPLEQNQKHDPADQQSQGHDAHCRCRSALADSPTFFRRT